MSNWVWLFKEEGQIIICRDGKFLKLRTFRQNNYFKENFIKIMILDLPSIVQIHIQVIAEICDSWDYKINFRCSNFLYII